MKTKEFSLPGFDRPVFVRHNDDWTGLAIVEWWDDKYRRVEVPARLILMLSFGVTKHWILAHLGISTQIVAPNLDPPDPDRKAKP